MGESFNPFGYSRALLYLIGATIILLGGFLALSLIRLDRQENALAEATAVPFVACNFTNTGAEPIPAYVAPFADPLYEDTTIPPSVPYPVLRVNQGYLFIEVRENSGAYVDQFRGLITGDCDLIEREDRPATDFPTVCRFTADAETTIYRTAALEENLDRTLPGRALVTTSQTDNAYFIATPSGLRGWVAADAGDLDGACGNVPFFEDD